jgi:CMP-N-acetylneuraminic acid synthetase
MKTVAFITARGGSTRTPNKNGRDFCGMPLFAWSIVQALNATNVDKVYFTTDNEGYAEIASHYGAEVYMRPVMDNGVTAGVPFRMMLDELDKEGVKFDAIFDMLPTSPLRKPGQIDELIQAFWDSKKDRLLTAAPMKETFILKNNSSYWDRFKEKERVPWYQGKNIVADKFWNYSKMCGGWNIGKTEIYRKIWRDNPILDYDIDTQPVDTETVHDLFAVEDWQTF